MHNLRSRRWKWRGLWEAALFAAHHKLSKLIAIVDRNGYQLDGAVDDVIGIEPLVEKWRAFGWETHDVEGNNLAAAVFIAHLGIARLRHNFRA